MISEEAPKTRPFQIFDMMILTAMIAFVFMIFEGFDDNTVDEKWLYYAMYFSGAITTGTFLASLIWILQQRLRTGRFVHHPGHWLLVIQATGALGYLGIWFVTSFFSSDGGDWDRIAIWWWGLNNLLSAGLWLIGFAVSIAAIVCCKLRWKFVMALMAMSALCTTGACAVAGIGMMSDNGLSFWGLSSYLRTTEQVVTVGVAIAICIAVVMDLVGKTKRDWLHWIGIATTLVAATVIPALQAYFAYLISIKAFNP